MHSNTLILILGMILAFLLLVLADNRLSEIERQQEMIKEQVNSLQAIYDESECTPKSLY